MDSGSGRNGLALWADELALGRTPLRLMHRPLERSRERGYLRLLLRWRRDRCHAADQLFDRGAVGDVHAVVLEDETRRVRERPGWSSKTTRRTSSSTSRATTSPTRTTRIERRLSALMPSPA